MARKRKTILNQIFDEPRSEVKSEGLVFEEPIVATPEQIEEMEIVGAEMITKEVNKRILDDIKELEEVEPEQEEISLKDSGEKLAKLREKENLKTEKDDEKVVDETPRPAGIRSLDKDVLKRLSHRERRFFQRTGILPK